MMPIADAEYFIQKAEQCFSLAQCMRAKRSNAEIAAALEALANEFLARAVALDTERDRAKTRKRLGHKKTA